MIYTNTILEFSFRSNSIAKANFWSENCFSHYIQMESQTQTLAVLTSSKKTNGSSKWEILLIKSYNITFENQTQTHHLSKEQEGEEQQ